GQLVRLNGYVVQKEAGKNDQALSPPGSTPFYSWFAGFGGSGGGAFASGSAYGSMANLPDGWLAVLDVTLLPRPKAVQSGASIKTSAHQATGFPELDGYVDPLAVAHLGPRRE